MGDPKKVVILGAAGRDFHTFNTVFRGDPSVRVVAFTAAQIPDIAGRVYPAALAGEGYPEGIPILPEESLGQLIDREGIDEVVFAYSDVPYEQVMHRSAIAMAHQADFRLVGDRRTMLRSSKPVVSVCAVRTGCGKSQTTRLIADLLRARGLRVVVVRHPMPYGDLAAKAVQRFASRDDLLAHHCTIEEIEEYEPHIDRGSIVYAGVDYEAILRRAEQEADVVLWDGGNNDTPFFLPDLEIVVADPLRSGDEQRYFPGEVNLRRADAVVINKIDSAEPAALQALRESIQQLNPSAVVIDAASPVDIDDPDAVRGKRVLVVEDGPTLTHGEMKYGAGIVAAQRFGASEIVDPRPFLQGALVETFEHYPEIGTLRPAMGDGEGQMRDLAATIAATDCDLVVIGTPIDLGRYVDLAKPAVRARYSLQCLGRPTVEDVLDRFLESRG